MTEQTVAPLAWIIVDDGSTDQTREVAGGLAHQHTWVRLEHTAGGTLERGAPIVRAFHGALATLEPLPDVIVKLDADMSMDADHFERLLSEFDRDPELGIAGGTGYERRSDGVWRQQHSTGPPVWGGCRAYRRECLRDILPLEEHMG